MLELNVEYRVRDYSNRWSIIDTHEKWALLENCTWGDETCYLVVPMEQEITMRKYRRGDGSIVELPTIDLITCETYDDIITALEDEDLI